MTPRRVLVLALVTQGVLAVSAWLLMRGLALDVVWGDPWRDTAIGLAAAGALALVNYLLIVHGPRNWVIDGVRSVYGEVFIPVFSRIGPAAVVTIGAAAGVGEEWFFRGIAQPVIGWPAASVAFGLAHIGGRRMLAFGVWATIMGAVLGGLALASGGLIAPIVAHAVYDMLALEYIRRGAEDE